MTDYELIQILSDDSLSRSEHDRAFSEFYQNNRRPFVVYIKSKNKKYDDETIYDWYQDSCVVLYDSIRAGKLSDAKTDIKLIHYLWRIGHNKYVDKCRKDHYQKEYEKAKKKAGIAGKINGKDISVEKDIFDRISETSEKISIAYQAVRAMVEPCNTILTLFYWDEKSGQEIADICGYANADSVKTQRFKCMNKLKAYIKKQIAIR